MAKNEIHALRIALVVAPCAALLGFAIVVHQIGMDARSLVIFPWGFIAIPAAIVPALRGGLHTITGITVWLVITWQALSYCGDMGAPYDHFLAAAPLVLAALVIPVVFFIILCVRVVRQRQPRYTPDLPPTIGPLVDNLSESRATNPD